MNSVSNNIIDFFYLVSVVFFILGLKRLGSPRTARQGNFLSMGGMVIAIIATLFNADMSYGNDHSCIDFRFCCRIIHG